MSAPVYITEEWKQRWRYAFDQARSDRERYFKWLKEEINNAIQLINRYDKIYVLGGLGSQLLATAPNLYNQFMETYEGPDKVLAEKEKATDDDEIEVLLEYAMSIASATNNENAGKLPSVENIQEIREQLSRIKFNIGFYEMSADEPGSPTEFDHWLKIQVMENALHVRGEGYHSHIAEVYLETFAPHNDFLNQFYGFNSKDLFDTITMFDLLVTSKIGNPFGASQSHHRFMEWSNEKGEKATSDEMRRNGKHFIQQFTEANPDLYNDESPETIGLVPLDYIEGYNRLFWILPKTEKEKKIFKLLSHEFGDNADFMQGKFGGFPLGDTIIQTKPLIKIGDKYYCFSINLAFRNLFLITASLLQKADAIYYEQVFKGNAHRNSRDNYIERKTKEQFEKLLPTVGFYHSLKYNITENGLTKVPELDILGVGSETIYVIEVKAGELNKKHRRGAIPGLKQRLKETVNEGSYQCYRAEQYIMSNVSPEFIFVDGGKSKSVIIDKSAVKRIIKISVTYEHFSTVSVNLRYLIDSGVLSTDYKWTWIVSLFDLMIFSDLIDSEASFLEYISNRLGLYERNDIQFSDEIDILGFYLDGNFPLSPPKANEFISMVGYKGDIDTYYNRKDVGMPNVKKPAKKNK
jgi:hypothetical protein